MNGLCGIFGRPYLDLGKHVDTSCFPALDREITKGLSIVEPSYTGGTLKWMGVVAPWLMDDGYLDAMHLVERMPIEDWDELVALSDDPSAFDRTRFREYTFGDETDHPFNAAQARFLELRGAYFPWKVCVHLLENDRWEDKHSGEGKDFTQEARRVFPQTVEFIERLPFSEIGRVVVFGLRSNDHAPLHRDSEPGKAMSVAQSITFDPRGSKRFVLVGKEQTQRTTVDANVYWFNDMDWHGVEAAPFFQYSIRVDGLFEPDFVRTLQREHGR